MQTILLVMLVLLLAGAAAIAVHDYVTGGNVILDFRDAWRLRNLELRRLDAAWAENPHRSGIVVSLTSTPSRLSHLGDTLKSLLLQTRPPAEIRLNIPQFSKREKTSYVVPDWLPALRSVRVVRCEDYGPATKFIPTLITEPPDRLVVVVDDDRIYPSRLLADLEAAAVADPGAAIGTTGWIVPADMTDRPTNFSNLFPRPPAPIMSTKIRHPCPVDILKGVSGYAVRPRFFDLEKLADYSTAPPEAFFVDDIWLSGKCRAPKIVIPTRRTNFHPRRRAQFYRSTSLGRLDSDKSRNTVMLKYFGPDCWRVGGPHNLR